MNTVIDQSWLDAHPGFVEKAHKVHRESKFRGYAATPGTGPQGETCRTCKHYAHNGSERGPQRYLKCDLMRALWTNGPGTDIKAKSPACEYWEDPHPDS